MSGKYNNYFSSLLDEETKSASVDKETAFAKSLFEGDKTSIPLDYRLQEKDADVIRKGIQETTRITQIEIINKVPAAIMKAIVEGLKQNSSVERVLYREYTDAGQEQDAQPYLREMLSIPRISFQIILKQDSSTLQLIQGDSANYIKSLHAAVDSQQLDELLFGLCNNKIITVMSIDRHNVDMKANNISLFGKLSSLSNLTLQIRPDECELLRTALKNNSLSKLNLSKSTITADGAHYLADLIANCTLTSLNLSHCRMDNDAFSIICQGILMNNVISTIDVQGNQFERLDLTRFDKRLLTERKHLQNLDADIFDSNMAKIFTVKRLHLLGNNFDGLATAKIDHLHCNKNLHEVQHVINLFKSLNSNKSVKSLLLFVDRDSNLADEICRQLIVNKTLKHVDITYLEFDEKSFKLLCEVIEKNNTIESLIHDGTFTITNPADWNFTYIPHQPLLEALKKNKSLTKVDFYRLNCEDWEVEEVLKANPFLTFTELANRTRGSRASKLNAKNEQNLQRRLNNTKCNVMSLGRSPLSKLLPMELWQLILDEISGSAVDYFDLFKQSMRQ